MDKSYGTFPLGYVAKYRPAAHKPAQRPVTSLDIAVARLTLKDPNESATQRSWAAGVMAQAGER